MNSSSYKTKQCENVSGLIESLLQLIEITHDGDLISKNNFGSLENNGLAQKVGNGFNIITKKD